MDEKWRKIREKLEKVPIAREKIEPLAFLAPSKWHIEKHKNKEILVLAEDRYCSNHGICLAVDLKGNVYRATMPSYEIYQYCAKSFAQFIKIAEAYWKVVDERESPSVFDEIGLCKCELQEKQFREYVQCIDATALSEEQYFWSVYAEEIGYGF